MLSKLNDDQLIAATKCALEVETKASVNVVRYYFEINRRELYLKRAKPTLFAFILDQFELDPPSVQRRVNAVKLAQAVPSLLDLIDQGKLGLCSAADIQTFLNAEQGRRNLYSAPQKRELVESVLGKSVREIRFLLTQQNPRVQFTESKKQISETQFKVTYITGVETEEMFERIKEVRSHVNPYASRDELLNYIFKLALEKIDPKRKAERAHKRATERFREDRHGLPTSEVEFNSNSNSNCLERMSYVPARDAEYDQEIVSEVGEVQFVMNVGERSRYVKARDRHEVQRASEGCCFVDPLTGKRCGSKQQLQYDHVDSFSKGGANTADNLQLMCGAHNRYRWRQGRSLVRAPTLAYAG